MTWHIAFLGKYLFYVYLRIVYALLSSAPEFYVCVLGISDLDCSPFYFYCSPDILPIT